MTLPIALRYMKKILKYTYAVARNQKKLEVLQFFKNAIDNQIENEIYAHSKRTALANERKKNGEELPNTEDIEIFQEFLDKLIDAIAKRMKINPSRQDHH